MIANGKKITSIIPTIIGFTVIFIYGKRHRPKLIRNIVQYNG